VYGNQVKKVDYFHTVSETPSKKLCILYAEVYLKNLEM